MVEMRYFGGLTVEESGEVSASPHNRYIASCAWRRRGCSGNWIGGPRTGLRFGLVVGRQADHRVRGRPRQTVQPDRRWKTIRLDLSGFPAHRSALIRIKTGREACPTELVRGQVTVYVDIDRAGAGGRENADGLARDNTNPEGN